MAADLRFIADAAERDTLNLPAYSGADRLGDRRFTYARRSYEAEYLTFDVRRQLPHGKVFNDLMLKRINGMLDTMQKAYDVMNTNLAQANVTDITDAYVAEDAINNMRDSLREEHLKNMEVKSYDYTAGVYYFDLIQELETMGDFMINISQALLGLNA